MYSLSDASQQLNCSLTSIYLYNHNHTIELTPIRQENNKIKYFIDEDSLILLMIKRDCSNRPYQELTTIDNFLKGKYMVKSEFKFNLYEAGVQPIIINPTQSKTKITTYSKADLQKVYNKSVHKPLNKKLHPKAYRDLNKQPNTNQDYNPQTDFNPSQLSKYLGHVNRTSIFQWVQYNRVEYQVDKNQKYFFTPEQAAKIKQQYRNIPTDYTANTKLAKKLNTHPNELSSWTKYHGIKHHKILGVIGIYYDKTATQYITDNYPLMYQNHKS